MSMFVCSKESRQLFNDTVLLYNKASHKPREDLFKSVGLTAPSQYI